MLRFFWGKLFEIWINQIFGLTRIFLKLSYRTKVRYLSNVVQNWKFLDFSYLLEVTNPSSAKSFNPFNQRFEPYA